MVNIFNNPNPYGVQEPVGGWWTGKGYGISNYTDVTGRPLLTYQGPNDKKPFLLADRVAQKFNFTVKQVLQPGQASNGRMADAVSKAAKKLLGGETDDELDHKISLELGGANTPANLFIQPGRASGASYGSDQLENTLALDVVAGRISLLDAWRILQEQKGFILAEEMQLGTSVNVKDLMTQLAGDLKDYIMKGKRANAQKYNAVLKAKMDQLLKELALNPLDKKKISTMFQSQVEGNAQQLGISTADSAQVTKSYLAAYTQHKGIDPREVMGALDQNVQQILKNSYQKPNIFGIPSTAITGIIAVIQTISTGLVLGGLILTIIGIFIAGPEAVVGALSGGLLESIGAIFGVSVTAGLGLTSFAVGEALNVAAIGLNMSTKQMYDNGYLIPTQNINALKEALAIQKGLTGFLPSTSESKKGKTVEGVYTPPAYGGGGVTQPPTGTTGGAGKAAQPPIKQIKVYSGIISQGIIGEEVTFVARESDLIETMADLETAAHNNLAPYILALPGKLRYEISVKPKITLKDGTVKMASSQKIVTGYGKTGLPKYKTVVNKFAVMRIFIINDRGKKEPLAEINLGPTDAAGFNPSGGDLGNLNQKVQENIITSKTAEIDVLVSPTPTKVVNIPPVTITQVPPTATEPVTAQAQQTPEAKQNGYFYQIPGYSFVQEPGGKTFINDAGGFRSLIQSITEGEMQKRGAVAVLTKTTINIPPSNNPNKCSVATIAEFFDINKVNYPKLAERAKSYEAWGLGTAALYTGTAEQNNKWLAEAKRRSGC